MAGNIQNVSFADPLDPGYAIQAEALQRQQALADAMRQQSLAPIEVNKGAISWTQGAAKLAQAIAANRLQNRANANAWDLAAQSANQMRSLFNSPNAPPLPQIDTSQNPYRSGGGSGLGGALRSFFGLGPSAGSATTGNAPQTAVPVQQPAPQAPTPPVQVASNGPTPTFPAPDPTPTPAPDPSQDISGAMAGLGAQAQAYGVPGTSQQQPPQPALPSDAAQAPAAPVPQQAGPLSLTGSPGQDYALYHMDPQAYLTGVVNSHVPGDFAKLLINAGIDPNSALGKQMMQAQIAKQNYVASESGRPGATIRDPFTKQIIGVDPQNIEATNPEIVNGQFTGRYLPAPGAAQAVGAVAAAKSVGQAAGDLVDVFNPATGQMDKVPKSTVLGGGFSATPPPGFNKASDVAGQNSAQGFQAISDGAADVPNRIYALKQMQGIVSGPDAVLGPGSQAAAHLKGVLGTIGQSVGMQAPPSVDNYQEFSKWASQYSARSAQELGLSGSDARVNLAIHATPNGEMTKGALQMIIPQMIGIENAKQGYAQAANAWQQQRGPQTLQQFRTAWNQVYDPRVYTMMAQGPQAFSAAVAKMPKPQAAQLRQHYLALQQIGALPQ